jgi:N-hydroxyarylamine O-acetyltransferase
MYEGLCEGLDSAMLRSYLERICSRNDSLGGHAACGTGGPDDGQLPEPTIETLDALIYAHQCSIPFETLDTSVFGLEISLATRDVFDKIVTRQRGGYCFELNTLFDKLLRALGYHVRSCLARAVINRDYLPPQLHRLPFVKLDGMLHMADVGFGGPTPAGSLALKEGIQSDTIGEVFRLSQEPCDWWLLERRLTNERQKEGWQKLLLFNTQPQPDVDFITPNYYCSKSPDSHFVINRIVNLRTPTGMVQLFNNTFKRIENGVTSERIIEDQKQLPELLNSSFGIKIP